MLETCNKQLLKLFWEIFPSNTSVFALSIQIVYKQEIATQISMLHCVQSQTDTTKQSLQSSIPQRELAQSILKQRLSTAPIDIAEIEFYMISHQHSIGDAERAEIDLVCSINVVILIVLLFICLHSTVFSIAFTVATTTSN